MSKGESTAKFYENKCDLTPDNLQEEIGHFNVFKLDSYVGKGAKPTPFRRRDYFKITLVKGNGKFHYADKIVDVQKSAIVFSNPQIPYSWEQRDRIIGGYFCLFDQAFFHRYGSLTQYSVFQPNGNPVFELTDEQLKILSATYERIFEEINSDYIHKYDVIRTIIFETIHFALKMAPPANLTKHPLNAAQRIATLFLELLERQFPIDDPHQIVPLRAASEYAEKLNIHVNHLNRAIKETTDKTTSQLIAQRIAQEAKILLRETAWPISEIAYVLGFNEVTHFTNFFKKQVQLSPMKFRNV